MVTKIYFKVYRGQGIADVMQPCPMCEKESHVIISGNKKVSALRSFLADSHLLQQELPFEIPVREFLRTGHCRRCMDLVFGTTSNKIMYVKGKE